MEGGSSLNAQLERAGSLLAPVNSRELNLAIIRLKNNRERIGLQTRVFNHLRSYGPDTNLIVDPPSSDEASGDESPEASYQAASEQILDTCLLKIKKKGSQIDTTPDCSVPPAIILTNLDPNLSVKRIKKTLLPLTTGLKKAFTTELLIEGGCANCALLLLRSTAEGSGELAGLLHGIRGMRRKVGVSWCEYEALDHLKSWAAVVLRNLPSDSSQESLRKVVTQFQIPVKRIEKPRTLGGSTCTLLIVEDIETAERICVKMNRMEIAGKRVKAHVHPDSRATRPPDSHHRIFNTEISSGTVSKPASKPHDAALEAYQQQVDSLATTSLGAGEATMLIDGKPSLEDGELARSGIVVMEPPGYSYTRDFGWVKHAGAAILCKLPG